VTPPSTTGLFGPLPSAAGLFGAPPSNPGSFGATKPASSGLFGNSAFGIAGAKPVGPPLGENAPAGSSVS